MAISEKIELLGKGLYNGIPDVLTLHSIPTASELDYVSSEDFDQTMLDTILPQAVEEKINFRDLLEIDYQWVLRALRIMNYGPYFTTNAIICKNCGNVHGEYQVNLNTVGCNALPEGFVNDLRIKADEFIDFNGEVKLKLPTIADMLNAQKDEAFKLPNGRIDVSLARMCYMIRSIKNNAALTPVEVKLIIQREFSPADYVILKDEVRDLTNYGLRAGGRTVCPKCGNTDAAFFAFVDDKFFRPTLGDLRKWRDDTRARSAKDVQGSKTTTVRKHN